MAKKDFRQYREAAEYLREQYPEAPEVGIVLGSGLGNFVEEILVEQEVPYEDIPHFPVSTVAGHGGKLIFGKLRGKTVVVLSGRFHFYEGYKARQVTFPIRVMKLLGVHTLLLSNAAGAVNPGFKVGDLMIIRDHISFFLPNPLIGKNIPELGPRFPDMSEPYSRNLIEKVKLIALAQNFEVKEGVYVAVTGPTYETPAEYRMIEAMGADAVGMSTIQENIVARHMDMKVFAMSVITDVALHNTQHRITHEEVLKAAAAAEPKLATLFKELVAAL